MKMAEEKAELSCGKSVNKYITLMHFTSVFIFILIKFSFGERFALIRIQQNDSNRFAGMCL